MPKQPKMQNLICDYILNVLHEQYKKQTANKITRSGSNLKKYPTKESLVDLVLGDQQFIDSQLYEEKQPGQATISKGTIRKAINKLISENKIALIDGSYSFVPHMEQSLQRHPILDIAPQIAVSIGVPEDLLVLSVQQGYAPSIASYLSAFFYMGDIVFIPIGNAILCISVYPKEMIDTYATPADIPNKSELHLRHRVQAALHKFKCSYPDFMYDHHYDFAYHISHNQEVIDILQASKDSTDIYPDSNKDALFRRVQEGIASMSEYMNNESDSFDYPNKPTQEELDLWDMIYDDENEELEKYK